MLVVAFAFGWFELRPIIIKKQCSKAAIEKPDAKKPLYIPVANRPYNKDRYDMLYTKCVRDSGL